MGIAFSGCFWHSATKGSLKTVLAQRRFAFLTKLS